MKVGICTWVFGHQRYPEMADYAASLGLDGVEVLVDIRREDPVPLRETFTGRGLEVFSMTPENVDIAHTDGARREEAVAYYEALVDFAATLGARAVTCHEYVGRREPEDCREQEWGRLLESCARIVAKAERQSIELVFEPLNRNIVSTVTTCDRALDLVHAVARPAFGIVLDTYHMHREEVSVRKAIERAAPHLKLLQIADSNRQGIGEGRIDFDGQFDTLAQIGYGGPVIIECAWGISGPALGEREVDIHALTRSIRQSVRWLRARIGQGSS